MNGLQLLLDSHQRTCRQAGPHPRGTRVGEGGGGARAAPVVPSHKNPSFPWSRCLGTGTRHMQVTIGCDDSGV